MQPRESMRGLPRLVQPFLTWVTGMPLTGAKPRVLWRPVLALIAGFVQTVVGVTIGVAGLQARWYLGIPLVLLSWPITAGGIRRLDVVVVHQTLHQMYTPSTRGNRIVSEIVTTLTWRPPYDENRKEHLVHHAHPCSLRDGDILYLASTGARPGMTRREFRGYLWRALISPRHHWSFFAGRMRGNFFSRPPAYRLAMSLSYLAATVVFLGLTGWWLQWLLLWFLPATFFFHNHTLLYTLSEHRWWLFQNAERLTKPQRDQLTFGRFCGTAVPQTGDVGPLRAGLAWTGWWARMLLLYAPYRLCILVGDTVQHDLHHVRPKCDWANSSWVRNADLGTNQAGRYFEVWGGLLSHVYVGNSVSDWITAEPSAPSRRPAVKEAVAA
ncbi:fatty acid desaturase [Micromonospora sp. NPDC005979]|uniref:fatty acid desaturase n=1 Tax=Micromonospora sp. NPDC005979 TaxID=3156726 RepID=UPI0033B71584